MDVERLRLVHDCPWLVVSALVFTARRHASAVCAIVKSVCLSQISVLLKQLNVGSRKQRYTIAQRLQFSDAENIGKLKRGQPQDMRQMQVG